jgi:hypothetical protein
MDISMIENYEDIPKEFFSPNHAGHPKLVEGTNEDLFDENWIKEFKDINGKWMTDDGEKNRLENLQEKYFVYWVPLDSKMDLVIGKIKMKMVSYHHFLSSGFRQSLKEKEFGSTNPSARDEENR